MYLAIDIGGSKTLLATFSASGKMLESKRFETPKNYSDFSTELKKSFQALETTDVVNCVVGVPGRVDRSRGVAIGFGNLGWENVPLAHDIEKICGVYTKIENDANLAGLSEASLIKSAYKKVLYVTVSTGIGGVIIVNGELWPEYADMEVGHMKFENDGKIMAWEEFASGKAIVKKYGKRASEIEDPQIWHAVSHDLGLGLTNVIVNHTPDVIVIGGGVGSHFEKFADSLHESLILYVTKLVPMPELRKAIRAEEAVIYGCYELAHQSRK